MVLCIVLVIIKCYYMLFVIQWSFGVTMWEIFSRGSHPYAAVDNMDILTYVKSGGRLKRPSQCPTQL